MGNATEGGTEEEDGAHSPPDNCCGAPQQRETGHSPAVRVALSDNPAIGYWEGSPPLSRATLAPVLRLPSCSRLGYTGLGAVAARDAHSRIVKRQRPAFQATLRWRRESGDSRRCLAVTTLALENV